MILANMLLGQARERCGRLHPAFRREQVYFHCPATAAHHAGGCVSGGHPDFGEHTDSAAAPWDATAPAGSLWRGEGCIRLDSAMDGADRFGEGAYGEGSDRPYESVFCGAFAGDLRDLTVTLHDLIVGQARPEGVGAMPLLVGLEIDGQSVLPAASAEKPSLWVTPVADGSGLVEKLEFSIVGLDSPTGEHDGVGGDGVGARRRTLRLTVGAPILDPSWVPPAMFVWNAVEARSGILFNPDRLANCQVAAVFPTSCCPIRPSRTS